MAPAISILKLLKEKDYKFFSGVPCSILKELLDAIFKDPEIKYIGAVKENIALGISSGAYLTGKKSGILIQNSGLGNIINALTSFNLIYRIPVLMFISWRGHCGDDAPEHLIMGEKTPEFLKNLNIPSVVLSEKFAEEIEWATEEIDKKSVPVAVLLRKGLIK